MRSIVYLVALSAVLATPSWADEASKTGDVKTPYIEHGELKNAAPEPKREPSPAEKTVKKVMEAPVRPTVINGAPGVEYHKSTP